MAEQGIPKQQVQATTLFWGSLEIVALRLWLKLAFESGTLVAPPEYVQNTGQHSLAQVAVRVGIAPAGGR